MAEVTTVVKAEAPVKSFTLEISRQEASDLKVMIQAYHMRSPFMGRAQDSAIYKALDAGLAGKTSRQAKFDESFAKVLGAPPYQPVSA